MFALTPAPPNRGRTRPLHSHLHLLPLNVSSTSRLPLVICPSESGLIAAGADDMPFDIPSDVLLQLNNCIVLDDLHAVVDEIARHPLRTSRTTARRIPRYG